MDLRNRAGLYGSYFLGMAGIGFTLPYLPLYLAQLGLTDRAIGVVSTLAAVAGLAQFPVGLWSDRIGWRKPFLIVALAAVAASTWFLRGAHGVIWIGLLVLLFAENGIGRAVVESLSGAEAAALAPAGKVGSALGALRFWKPIGIILMTEAGGWLAESRGLDSILVPLFVVQCLAVAAAFLIHEPASSGDQTEERTKPAGGRLPKDPGLWAFVAAMVLYHAANAPGGVYLGLYMKRELHAPERMLSHAFAVSMLAWMIVVWPAGWLADRWGRKPLLVIGWTIMALRLALVALVRDPRPDRGQPGARRPGQRPLRGDGGLLGDGPTGRPPALGRGPGDRRLGPGPRLGDRPGGGRGVGGCARLPGPLLGPRGGRRGRRRPSSSRSSPRPSRPTTRSARAGPSDPMPATSDLSTTP